MSAEQFGSQWLTQTHGRPGFSVLGYRDDPEFQHIVVTAAQCVGTQVAWNTAGFIEYHYDDGTQVDGILAVSTTGVNTL